MLRAMCCVVSSLYPNLSIRVVPKYQVKVSTGYQKSQCKICESLSRSQLGKHFFYFSINLKTFLLN